MTYAKFFIIFSALPLLALAPPTLGAPRETGFPVYHEIKRFKIGGEERWDHLTLDSKLHWLYVAQAQKVLVINTNNGQLVGEVGETPGARAVALVPKLEKGFASSGQGNSVTVFNMKDLKVTAHVQVGEKPDLLIYDEVAGKIFVFNGVGKSATVIDPKTNKVVETIDLGGKPEGAISDRKGRVYVNLQDLNALAAIDVHKLKVVAQSQLKPCEGPKGAAFDARLHRIFIGCSNSMAISFDTAEQKVKDRLEVGRGVDDVAFDAESRLVFVSAGEGRLHIFRDAKKGVEEFQKVDTPDGSHTMAVDPASGNVFVPSAEFTSGLTGSPTTAAPGGQNSIVKGSFSILVIGR